MNGATLVPTTVTYDWQTKKLQTWRTPAVPEIDVSTFAKAELEEFPARDGTMIPMLVRRPKQCRGVRRKPRRRRAR